MKRAKSEKEDDRPTIHIIAAVLLYDGRADERLYGTMQLEGCFSRIIELLQTCETENTLYYGLFLELLYEMSRIQQLRWNDLGKSMKLMKAAV